jgi:prepilin-type processing-associated H-X9-DG protein
MCWHDATADVASMFWIGGGSQTAAGYTLGASEMDGGQLIHPKKPQFRYRGPGADRFADPIAYPPASFLNPNDSIAWWSDKGLIRYGGYPPSANADTWGIVWNFAYGGPRWRHNGNTTCNVAFADGSVRGLQLGREIQVGSDFVNDTEFRRYMIMLRWPNNKKDNHNE